MATELTVEVLAYGPIRARIFFDTELGYGGLEIYQNGEHLGSMIDVSFPDENDEDEMEWFINKLENWLIDNGH